MLEGPRLWVLRLLLVEGRVAWLLLAELRAEERLVLPKEMPLSTLRRGSSVGEVVVEKGEKGTEVKEAVIGEDLALVLGPPVIS